MRESWVEKVAFWEFVLQEQARSELGVREFCRREDVSEASFYLWRKKLDLMKDANGRSADRSLTSRGHGGFMPVRVTSAGSQGVEQKSSDVHDDHCRGSLTIRTCGGYAIEVSPDSTKELIVRCLADAF